MLTAHEKKFKVSRTKLITDLEASLVKHRADYAAAIRDYKTALIANLNEALKDAKKVTISKIEDIRAIRVEFDAPVSHEKEIVRALEVLQYMDAVEVEIDEATFNAYVRNEWSWTNTFLANAVKYSSQASRSRK
jgi:hypothetical protein